MVKYVIAIGLALMAQMAGAHVRSWKPLPAPVVCVADSLDEDEVAENDTLPKMLMAEDELRDDTIRSKYAAEKEKGSDRLDSLSRITAPFSIRDLRGLDEMGNKKKKVGEPYILQNIYMEEGKKFSRHWYDRLDVGLASGYYRIAPRGIYELDGGVPLGAYAKYNLNRLSAFRLEYTYTRFGLGDDGSRIEHIGVDLDFMYNLSSFLYGHNPKRVLNVSAVVGGGAIIANLVGKRNKVWKGQVGLNFDFKLSPSSHLFVEPFVALVGDQMDFSAETNEHKWDAMYGLRAGLGVNLNTRNDSLSRVNYNGNVFWDFGRGVTFFSSDNQDMSKSVGTSYRVGVGKWLDPYVGVRVSYNFADFCWATTKTNSYTYGGFKVVPSYETDVRAVMAGARVELLLDVLNLFRRYRMHRHPMFSWQLSVGGEFGFMWKRMTDKSAGNKLYTGYSGVTVGTQFMYSLDKYTALYAEPYMLSANYSVPYVNAPTYKVAYTDKLYGVNVGVRVLRPVKKELVADSIFEPRQFVGVSLGGTRGERFESLKGDYKLPLSGGLLVGKEFKPFLAAKLAVDYQTKSVAEMYPYRVDEGVTYTTPAMFNQNYSMINARLLYMLNFSNLYQGYNRKRKVNMFLELGPGYVHVLNKNCQLYSQEMPGGTNPTPIIPKNNGSEGGFCSVYGMLCDIKFNGKLRLFMESYVQIFENSSLFDGVLLKYDKDLMMGVNLGVTYDF